MNESPSMEEIERRVRALCAPGEIFALTTRLIDGAELPFFAATPPNLAAFYQLCLQHGDLDFIVYGEERLTFRQVHEQMSRFAHALVHRYAIAKGDRVAIIMRNYPEWMIAFMAITAIGAVAVPMNSWWQGEELAAGLADSGTVLTVVDGERLSRLNQAGLARPLRLVMVRDEAAGADNWSDILAEAQPALPPVSVDAEDDAFIMYTSGSTGYPKGAVSPHRGVMTAVLQWVVLGLAITGDGAPQPASAAILLTVPLFHVTGLNNMFLLSLAIGRKVVMMHKWDVTEAMRLIERERVTYFNGVPTMSMELANAPDRDKYDLSSLTAIAGGGAARPAAHVAAIHDRFPNVTIGLGYGLTETNAIGAGNAAGGYLTKPASTGKANWPIVRIKIIDDQGCDLPQGQVGEICIQSASNCKGYWNRPEDSAEAFRDGWFHSGDLGFLDADDFLFIVDRKKEIIIRGGENISCLEVEAALADLPMVSEAAVFGLPDDRLGEIVGAVVQVRHASVSADTVRQALAKHLAAYKIPAHIWLTTARLPRIASEKVDRQALKAKYAKMLKSR